MNSFDRIYDFEDRLKKEAVSIPIQQSSEGQTINFEKITPKLTNVFFHNNQLFYGFVNFKNHQYHLLDFTE